MQRFFLTRQRTAVLACTVAGCLAACSPTFNWRDVRPEDTTLAALMPCKPDSAQRKVALGNRPVVIRLLGCDAGGVTFALAVADVGDASGTAAALAQWQNVTLVNMKALPVESPEGARSQRASTTAPLRVRGAALQPPGVQVTASGQRADGAAVHSQAAYFVHGTQVFQAVIYAVHIKADVAETFFSSLKLE